MVSLSVPGNERERTSGTSENARSRTCTPPAAPHAADLCASRQLVFSRRFPAVGETEHPARPEWASRRLCRSPACQRCGEASMPGRMTRGIVTKRARALHSRPGSPWTNLSSGRRTIRADHLPMQVRRSWLCPRRRAWSRIHEGRGIRAVRLWSTGGFCFRSASRVSGSLRRSSPPATKESARSRSAGPAVRARSSSPRTWRLLPRRVRGDWKAQLRER